mmetsp:Transcript_2689/g.5012  ORF Transcript_2689/g.5012 Transcript_2689/m.5012 type:complete len:257 (-) Transcript_2689:7804-8574(-)
MTAGILAATLLITATTIDDSVWLIPYCTSPHLPNYTKIIHGATFVMTLECLTILCVIFSNIFHNVLLRLGGSKFDESFVLGLAGAIMCWAIAIGLYVKKWMKRRQRRRRRQLVGAETTVDSVDHESLNLVHENEVDARSNPPATEEQLNEFMSDTTSNSSDNSERDVPSTPSIKMIISLTILGTLDEMSYFPALLVGKVFSPFELILGTGFATAIVLVIVLAFLSKFKPLVDFLDGIPLYGIVGIFAVILTIGLFW